MIVSAVIGSCVFLICFLYIRDECVISVKNRILSQDVAAWGKLPSQNKMLYYFHIWSMPGWLRWVEKQGSK